MAQNFTNTLPKNPANPFALAPKNAANPFAAPVGGSNGTATPFSLSSVLQSKANAQSIAPTAPVQTPKPVTAPVAKTPVASPTASYGSYKGVKITPGDDASVKSQMAAIDGKTQAPASQPQTTPLYPAVAGATYQVPPAPLVQPVSQTPVATEPPKGLYGQLIDRASSSVDEAKSAQEASRLFTLMKGQSINDVTHRPDFSLDTGVGRAGQIQQNLGLQEQSLATQAEQAIARANANTNIAGLAAPQGVGQGEIKFDPVTGQQITAGGVQVPYSNQYLNTATGQPMGGGAVSGSLYEAVANVAQRVKSGAMSYDQGVQALAGYGQGGLNALTQALGNNFNISQSNATANAREADILQTGTTGGQVSKAASSALGALDILGQTYQALGTFTGGSNIPVLNQVAQYASMQTGIGREKVSAFQGALKEARAQINAVLAPVVGVESANATSNSLLPDNMTPGEIPQKIQAAKDYVNQRVQSFTTPSTSLNQNYSGGGSVTGIGWGDL